MTKQTHRQTRQVYPSALGPALTLMTHEMETAGAAMQISEMDRVAGPDTRA